MPGFDTEGLSLNTTPDKVYMRPSLRWWAEPKLSTAGDTAQPIIFADGTIEIGAWVDYAITQEFINLNTSPQFPSVEQVANIAARDALVDPTDGDVALILDADGSGSFGVSHYDDVTGWSTPIGSLAGTATLYSSDGTIVGPRIADGGGNDLTFTNVEDFLLSADTITLNEVSTVAGITFNTVGTTARMFSTSAYMEFGATASDLTISWPFIITDARAGDSQQGLQYAADYSADFDNRSLVDKEYVDTSNNPSIYTASGTVPTNITATLTDNFVIHLDGSAPISSNLNFEFRAQQNTTSPFSWGNVDQMIIWGDSLGLGEGMVGLVSDGDAPDRVAAVFRKADNAGTQYTEILAKEEILTIKAEDGGSEANITVEWDNITILYDQGLFESELTINNLFALFRSTQSLRIVPDGLDTAAPAVANDTLLQLGNNTTGEVNYTPNRYPTALPGVNSVWRFNTDGTGTFVDITTLGGGSFLPLAGGTMLGGIDMNGQLLTGMNGSGDNSIQTINGSGSMVFVASDGVDTTTTTMAGSNGQILVASTFTFAGIEYSADYSANYSARSLVDKTYVDTEVSDKRTFTVNNAETTSFSAAIENFYPVDLSIGSVTASLPALAANAQIGILVLNAKTEAGNVFTISSGGTDILYRSTTAVSSITGDEINGQYFLIESDGTNWFISSTEEQQPVSRSLTTATLTGTDTDDGAMIVVNATGGPFDYDAIASPVDEFVVHFYVQAIGSGVNFDGNGANIVHSGDQSGTATTVALSAGDAFSARAFGGVWYLQGL